MDYKDKLITKHIECVIYGEEKFDEIKFRYVRNSDYRNKPVEGGLWASPINSQYGWKEWCLDERFLVDELNKKFEVDFIGSVYLIDKYEDLVCIPFIDTGYNKIPILKECLMMALMQFILPWMAKEKHDFQTLTFMVGISKLC